MKKVLKINPFFVEMIFVLLIMTVCITVFIKLFAAVNIRLRESRDKNRAMIEARSKIEFILSERNAQPQIENYDSGWNKTTFSPNYRLKTEIAKEQYLGGEIENIEVKVERVKDKKLLCLFSTEKYLMGGENGA